MRALILIIGILVIDTNLKAEDQWHSYSFGWQAWAPNAGGQTAYVLRRGSNSSEWSAFMNEYLLAGGYPLLGASYNWRFPICGQACFWQFYAQAGGGLTTGGPILEVGWSTTAFWVARVDFTTQMFFTTRRLVSWSYPAWIGLSVPLKW